MLFRRSEESEQRILMIVGAVVLSCCIVAGYVAASDRFRGRPSDEISIAIDTPYVGQGVRAGTPLIMHGVQVGVVRDQFTLPSGGVRLLTDFQKGPVVGLTDTMGIDFRPINYFGVTGINVVPGPGGNEIRDGMQLSTVPQDNSTLQALLSRLGRVSTTTLTPELVSVIDRVVQYTDGLNPLVETMLIATHAVADVQTESTARLLANATGVMVAFPSFADATVKTLFDLIDTPRHYARDYWVNGPQEVVHIASTELFGGLGRIESNYVDDLLPAVDSLKTFTDPVPALLRPTDFANTLVELRTRYEKLFAGNGEQRAVQVKIILDSLPGVAAPLSAMGGPQ